MNFYDQPFLWLKKHDDRQRKNNDTFAAQYTAQYDHTTMLYANQIFDDASLGRGTLPHKEQENEVRISLYVEFQWYKLTTLTRTWSVCQNINNNNNNNNIRSRPAWLSVLKDFDFGAALQCCPSAWQFAGYRLMIVPNFVFSLFFKLPRSGYTYQGSKIGYLWPWRGQYLSLPAHLSFNPATQLDSATSELLRPTTFRFRHFLSV